MSHRKILGILLLVITVAVVFALILVYPAKFGLCSLGGADCFSPHIFNFSHPIIFGLLPVVPILIILFFLRREVFTLWYKFALVFFLLMIFWIMLTPIYCNDPFQLCLDKKRVSLIAGTLFFLFSVIIITVKSLRLREKKI